jgi:hypothetical protein
LHDSARPRGARIGCEGGGVLTQTPMMK